MQSHEGVPKAIWIPWYTANVIFLLHSCLAAMLSMDVSNAI